MVPMSVVEPSGWARGEAVPSGFRTTEPERPVEFGPDSRTLTATEPAGFDALAKTGRAAPERAGTVTARTLVAAVCWKDAATPAPGARLSVNVRSCAVRFWSVTMKARAFGAAKSGLMFWGEPTTRPSVIRLE